MSRWGRGDDQIEKTTTKGRSKLFGSRSTPLCAHRWRWLLFFFFFFFSFGFVCCQGSEAHCCYRFVSHNAPRAGSPSPTCVYVKRGARRSLTSDAGLVPISLSIVFCMACLTKLFIGVRPPLFGFFLFSSSTFQLPPFPLWTSHVQNVGVFCLLTKRRRSTSSWVRKEWACAGSRGRRECLRTDIQPFWIRSAYTHRRRQKGRISAFPLWAGDNKERRGKRERWTGP